MIVQDLEVLGNMSVANDIQVGNNFSLSDIYDLVTELIFPEATGIVDGWHFRKWSNFEIEMWMNLGDFEKSFTALAFTGSAESGLYIPTMNDGLIAPIAYPFVFLNEPYVNVSVTKNVNITARLGNSDNLLEKSPAIQVYSNMQDVLDSTQTYNLKLHVKGKLV